MLRAEIELKMSLFTVVTPSSSQKAPPYSDALLLVKVEFDSQTLSSFSRAPPYSEVFPVKVEPLIVASSSLSTAPP